MRIAIAIAATFFFFSCGSKNELPKGIIEPKKMERVLWDYLRADVYATDYLRRDSILNDTIENAKLQQRVFDFYNVSKESFYKSYEYYLRHSDIMKDMLDSMTMKQNRKNVVQRMMPLQ